MSAFYRIIIGMALLSFVSCTNESTTPSNSENMDSQNIKVRDWVLVIHGGAGVILPENMDEQTEIEIEHALDSALRIGKEILVNGGDALEAVTQTILILENSPHFNAGKGAVLNHEGNCELDASIMDGNTLNAGAIAGTKKVKNPILLARAVMEQSDHVMLSGDGADVFAEQQGLEFVGQDYYKTERRIKALEEVLGKERGKKAEERGTKAEGRGKKGEERGVRGEEKHGTVGAVALDKKGNLAAGTSTGGMTNKRYNRIGDSPVIGAGTYADNTSCAVSCTGHGEYFIRYAVAHDLAARVKYSDMGLEEAANEIIHKELLSAGGKGGLIAVDYLGNYTMPFNTEGMFRGVVGEGNLKMIEFYKEK